MSPEPTTSTDASSETPIANMEALMAQLGATKANTTIVGSATAVQDQPQIGREAQAQ